MGWPFRGVRPPHGPHRGVPVRPRLHGREQDGPDQVRLALVPGHVPGGNVGRIAHNAAIRGLQVQVIDEMGFSLKNLN